MRAHFNTQIYFIMNVFGGWRWYTEYDMKGRILANKGIILSVCFSVVLIVGAFFLARGFNAPPTAQASEETALLKAIASKDSDSDGLPDWQEALYGTDPKNSDSNHLGMSDSQAVAKGLIVPKAIADVPAVTSTGVEAGVSLDPSLPPPPAEGTLTAAFTQQFFNLYLSARSANGGEDLSEEQLSQVANQAITSLSAVVKSTPPYKSKADLKIKGSGSDAMISFAAAAENILVSNQMTAKENEIVYLKRALQDGDQDALLQIASIAKVYRESAIGLAVLPVPAELADADLAAINALMQLSQIISDFTRIDSDPIVAMLAISRYGQAVQDLAVAVQVTGVAFLGANITIPTGEPGSGVVTMTEQFALQHTMN